MATEQYSGCFDVTVFSNRTDEPIARYLDAGGIELFSNPGPGGHPITTITLPDGSTATFRSLEVTLSIEHQGDWS